jgi:hypothetical protein
VAGRARLRALQRLKSVVGTNVARTTPCGHAIILFLVVRPRGGNADYHRPNKFYLTFSNWRGAEAEPPSHDRKRIKSMDEAERIAREARAARDRNAVSFGKFAWRRRNLKTYQQKWAEKNLRRKREEMAEREKHGAPDILPAAPFRKPGSNHRPTILPPCRIWRRRPAEQRAIPNLPPSDLPVPPVYAKIGTVKVRAQFDS